MRGFIKVKVSSSRVIRININHIIYYEPFQKAAHTAPSTRIYILNDCVETEMSIDEVDYMIMECEPK